MYCLVEYGKKKNKGVKEPKIFYSGMQLNIIYLLEFLKNYNENIAIILPYFLSVTTNKDLAESYSKIISEKERKEKMLYSVFMEINTIIRMIMSHLYLK